MYVQYGFLCKQLLPIIKYLFSRDSYVCLIWIFTFDTDQAQINSVVQELCNWHAASIEAPEDVFPVHEVGNQDQVCATYPCVP